MKRRVLFVDDDQVLRHMLKRHFEEFREHFSVVMAGDGFEAVKTLEKSAFSLVVLDLVMPRMDGMSLLAHLREKYPDIPVVSISAMDADHLEEFAEVGGIVAHLAKPFKVAEVTELILKVLKQEAEGGILHDVSPAIFLQLIEMDGKSCTIRVLDERSTQGGILYFIDGQLVDVRIGALSGTEAAYQVFTWERVTIFLRNSCSPRINVINSELQPIIMKAAGMRDEAGESPAEDEHLARLLPGLQLAGASPPEGYTGPERRVPVTQAAAGGLSLAGVRTILEQQAKAGCRLEDLRINPAMVPVLELLTELGRSEDLGDFQVACLQHGNEIEQLLLPGGITALVGIAGDDGSWDRLVGSLRGRRRR